MASQQTRRPFRAEIQRKKAQAGDESDATSSVVVADDGSAQGRHDELMGAIQQLRSDIASREHSAPAAGAADTKLMEEYKREVHEVANLRHELQELSDAIHATKKEIARLHPVNPDQDKLAAMTDELDAVVMATEGATETILTASEVIEGRAESLRMHAEAEEDHASIDEISEQIMKIFEACNFQDLTGQRITRVVNTLRFIEERVDNMIAVLGGEEEIKDVVEEVAEEVDTTDGRLLHGPTDGEKKISQDEIDSLFD